MKKTINRRELGAAYEQKALHYFLEKGWKLLCQNYQSLPIGEIDLIFEDPQKAIVFVEVRSRSSLEFGSAFTSISKSKQTRLIKTALTYIKKFQLYKRDYRFDILTFDSDGIQHFPNAFTTTKYTL